MMDSSELYLLLLSCYGKPHWWSDDPYTVMVQSVMVQNTSWKNVEKATEGIGDKLRPETVEKLSQGELESLIRPVGFPKRKAGTIRELTEWYERYGYSRSEVMAEEKDILRSELLMVKGVGEETADVILIYAFFKPSFAVDAYTRRFLSRFGYCFGCDDEIRKFMKDWLGEDAAAYGFFHSLILEHSIKKCKKDPDCVSCPIKRSCAYPEKAGTACMN